jgi:hypothetical protein
MDADILLPPQTKIILENADLNPQHVYGIDRFNIRGYKAYAKLIDMPKLQHECNTYIHVDKYPVGTRLMHAHGSGVFRYPEGHTNAGREDTLFSQLWPRRDRTMIPEIIGYHLESDDAGMAANWNGRTTSPFEYEG